MDRKDLEPEPTEADPKQTGESATELPEEELETISGGSGTVITYELHPTKIMDRN